MVMSKTRVFDTNQLPEFNPFQNYYSEVRFGTLQGASFDNIKADVQKLLEKMEAQIITFIPIACRSRVRWYAKMPEPGDEDDSGAVGWDYKGIEKI
jgi:hypothetical protein